jgi:hypothetical protein
MHVHVYVIKGMVEVDVEAKSQAEAMDKAIALVEAEQGYHGNYPQSDRKYLAVMNKEVS